MKVDESMKKKIMIVLLVCVCILTTGCMFMRVKTDEKESYEAGEFIIPWSSDLAPKMGIKAETNEFEKDDVTLELFCGLYHSEYAGENFENAKSSYQSDKKEPLVVALYVDYDEGYGTELDNITDYRNIKNRILLKEWSEEEAFEGEFLYYAPKRTITYTHSEMITIPENCFSKESGTLSLCFTVFKYQTNGLYSCARGTAIELDYEITDEGKVLITSLK